MEMQTLESTTGKPTSLDIPLPIANKTAPSAFSETIDQAKIEVVKEASVSDEKFVKDFKEKLKNAAIKSAELEKEKQELEKQNIVYEKELLLTQQKLNEYMQAKDSWESRQRNRQFHYDGVAPVMEFVGIKKPLNVVILYLLFTVLIMPFLASKLFKGTIGSLIAGAEDSDRPKAVKGFIYTMLGVIFVLSITFVVYLGLQWLKII